MPSLLDPMTSIWQRRRIHPLPAATVGKVGSAPHLGNTTEWTLLTGSWISPLENMNLRNMAPTFICHMASWEEEGCPPTPTPLCLRQVVELALRLLEQESDPCRASPASVLRRVGPVTNLESTVEPTLLAEVWMSQAQSCEHGITVPNTHLLAMEGGRCIFTLHHLQQIGS